MPRVPPPRGALSAAPAAVVLAVALVVAGCGATASSDVDPGARPSGSAAGGPVQQPREDVFDVRSPWNTTVRDAPVRSGSSTMLARADVHAAPTSRTTDGVPVRDAATGGVHINTHAWTEPVVAGGVPTSLHCRQTACGVGTDGLTLDVPADVDPDPLYDGWFTVFDETTDTAYDLWRARREDDGTISYQFMRTWDLDGPGFAQPYIAGARGSGLPLFAGLIRPGELERGRIDHALAISLPGPARSYFVQPASSTDGSGPADSVPEGARLRLRADFVLRAPVHPHLPDHRLPFHPAQRRDARTILRALKTYGAIVVDRAATPTLYFESAGDDARSGRRANPLGTAFPSRPADPRAPLQGYELQQLHLSDFAVVGTWDARFPYPPPDQDVGPSVLAGGHR